METNILMFVDGTQLMVLMVLMATAFNSADPSTSLLLHKLFAEAVNCAKAKKMGLWKLTAMFFKLAK